MGSSGTTSSSLTCAVEAQEVVGPEVAFAISGPIRF
jgi:hypothetical protein